MELHKSWLIIFAGLILAASLACAGEDRNVELTVSRMDTLINLCKKYLNEPERWPEVAKINKLADPNKLSPGQKLKIPVDWLKGGLLYGKVDFLKGDVLVKDKNEQVWRLLRQQDSIAPGSTVKTGADSSVEISFEDGTAFLMQQNTVVHIKTASGGVLHLLKRLYLEAGKIVSRIRSATGRSSRYEIETPSALAAARGTIYRVSVDDKKSTRAEVLESSVSVSAAGKTVAVTEGEGSVIRMNESPSIPQKLLIPPEFVGLAAQYTDGPVETGFTLVQGASYYRVILSRDSSGKDIAVEQIIRPEEKFKPGKIEDGTYFISVSAMDDQGLEGRLSSAREIVYKQKPMVVAQPVAKERIKPAVPHVISPKSEAKGRETSREIRWEKALGASVYRLQVALDSEFASMQFDKKDLWDTFNQVTNLIPGTIYFYRVRGESDDGLAGDWTPTGSFMVLKPPATLQLEKPVPEDRYVSFRWDRPEPGNTYQLQVSRDQGFKEVILDRRMADPGFVFDIPKVPGNYVVRVRAIDANGLTGNYSAAQMFEVKTPERFPYELLGILGLAAILFAL